MALQEILDDLKKPEGWSKTIQARATSAEDGNEPSSLHLAKAALKELILSTDERVMAAVEVHEIDGDDEEILDTLKRIAARALVEAQEMYSS